MLKEEVLSCLALRMDFLEPTTLSQEGKVGYEESPSLAYLSGLREWWAQEHESFPENLELDRRPNDDFEASLSGSVLQERALWILS